MRTFNTIKDLAKFINYSKYEVYGKQWEKAFIRDHITKRDKQVVIVKFGILWEEKA